MQKEQQDEVIIEILNEIIGKIPDNIIENQYLNNLPSRLKHIKNEKFLKYSLDPINIKYVKKVWAHKLTKLEREKRDMIWEYYRYRGKMPVCDALKKTYCLNIKDVTIIYFDDPVQYRFIITNEMFEKIKKDCREHEAIRKVEKEERKKKKEQQRIIREQKKLKKLEEKGLTLEDLEHIKAKRKIVKKIAQQKKKEEKIKKKISEPKKKFYPKNKDKYDPVLRKLMKEKKEMRTI